MPLRPIARILLSWLAALFLVALTAPVAHAFDIREHSLTLKVEPVPEETLCVARVATPQDPACAEILALAPQRDGPRFEAVIAIDERFLYLYLQLLRVERGPLDRSELDRFASEIVQRTREAAKVGYVTHRFVQVAERRALRVDVVTKFGGPTLLLKCFYMLTDRGDVYMLSVGSDPKEDYWAEVVAKRILGTVDLSSTLPVGSPGPQAPAHADWWKVCVACVIVAGLIVTQRRRVRQLASARA